MDYFEFMDILFEYGKILYKNSLTHLKIIVKNKMHNSPLLDEVFDTF